MTNYTDEQIKKALECCVKSTHFGECFENKCPMVSEDGCAVGKETLYPYALDLINRQEAEIENLKTENQILSQKRMNIFEKCEAFERGRVKGIKEFAERLCEGRVSNDPVVIAVKCELKEMVGESK